jgi:hypothetical protein
MSSTIPSSPATVQVDQKRNRFFIIYLSAWILAAAVLFTLTAVLGWGFYGWAGGGFCLLVGLGGLGGMAKTGGAGKLACPKCQHEIEVLHISTKRVMPCPSCATWLEGAESMAPVPQDRVCAEGDGQPFVAPLLEGAQWPEACPLCGGAATRRVKVEGAPGAAGALVASQVVGVGVYKRYTIEVPACSAHDAPGVAIAGITHDRAPVGVAFGSFGYWRKFCEKNGLSTADAPAWLGMAQPTRPQG